MNAETTAELKRAPVGADDFFRAFSIVMDGRKVREDTVFHGCPTKKGDMVMLTIPASRSRNGTSGFRTARSTPTRWFETGPQFGLDSLRFTWDATRMSTVKIDRQRCTGQGRCYSLSPDVFYADDEGFGLVEDEVIESGTDLAGQAEIAVLSCPESAAMLESTP